MMEKSKIIFYFFAMEDLTLISDLFIENPEKRSKWIFLKKFNNDNFDFNNLLNIIYNLPDYFEYNSNLSYYQNGKITIGYIFNIKKAQPNSNLIKNENYNGNDLIFNMDLSSKLYEIKIRYRIIEIISFKSYLIKNSIVDNRNRILKNEKERIFFFFYIIFSNRDSLYSSSKKPSWVKAFKTIKKRILGYNYIDNINYIQSQIDLFYSNYNIVNISTFKELENHIIGNLKLGLSKIKTSPKQFKIKIDNDTYYIIYARWISPFSISILNSNILKAIEWD